MQSIVRNLKILSRLPVSNLNSFETLYTKSGFNTTNSLKSGFNTINSVCSWNYCPQLSNKFLQSIENLYQPQREVHTVYHVRRPRPETYKKNCFFKVHYPEDGKYTTKKLKLTKLGGRDPDTGRVIFGKVGGGSKRYYRWVLFDRLPPGTKDPFEERVIHVQYDPNRSAKIALVGHGDQLRFIIATTSMQSGDLIKSTRDLPRIPIRPNEGDAHPVGALPAGTVVCCVELLPHGPAIKLAGGASATIVGRKDDKVIIQANKLKEYALDPNCLAVVGQVSMRNKPIHPIGSPQRLRWLGKRPGSGLWQRKDGRYGRKIKQKKPPEVPMPREEELRTIDLTLTGEGPTREITPSTNRVS